MLLAGDLGATKTLLGLFDLVDGRPVATTTRRYPTQTFASAPALLNQFWHDIGARHALSAAAFGVAGPVMADTARLTNVAWSTSVSELREACQGVPISLINDVAAIAYGVPALDAADLVVLQTGERVAGAPISILSVGTGLGAATAAWCDGRTVVLPSETGHADFAPCSDRDFEVAQALRRIHGRCAIEHVVSGSGLVAMAGVLHGNVRCAAVGDGTATDLPAATARAAAQGACVHCVATLDVFVRALGSEAGNVALRTLPYGGLYLAGGVSAKLRDWLTDGRWLEAFLAKPPMEGVLRRVPVAVITNEDAGLLGAAVAAAASVTGAR